MEAFENTFDNYFWLANVVQDTLSIIYNETNNVIIEKINSILKTLNIEEKHPEKRLVRKHSALITSAFSIASSLSLLLRHFP